VVEAVVEIMVVAVEAVASEAHHLLIQIIIH
jgi:hypothetical protein